MLLCFFRLHVQLMDLQQKQINSLADWLTVAEKRIEGSENIGSDLDTVKRQVENHKVCLTISCYGPLLICDMKIHAMNVHPAHFIWGLKLSLQKS